jgi:acetolactate synthase I/II/III large subunit
MTGAEILLKTAVNAGVEVCFTNPGTTEMPLVCSFDSVAGIRPILGLFEGCCTGAADGYGRMADKPAMTLLHLGPGLGNGIANLHNARRARTPVFNVIGEHASWHRSADAPLSMDIVTLAETVSGWQRTSTAPQNLSRDTADAVAAALQGKVATLIVPSDVQWSESSVEKIHLPEIAGASTDKNSIERAADLLRTGPKAALILGGRALRQRGLAAAARIKAKAGCDLISERTPARMERGVGIAATDFIPYFPRQALDLLSRYQTIVLAGAAEPVTFFGWQGYASRLLNDDQDVCKIKAADKNLPQALENLAEALGAPGRVDAAAAGFSQVERPNLPQGRLTAQNACRILAALQPEHAIIVNESITSGAAYFPLGSGLPPHTLLMLPGGAIGYGMPCAVGAAIACPQRPVIDFQSDGSAMYTVQALWMQAREGLNITTLICSNRSYNILNIEIARSGITSPGRYAQTLTDLSHPAIDWVQISKGMGVPAVAVDRCESMAKELKKALAEPGPHLIEMII